MKAFKFSLLAGLMLVPFAVSAQAADLAPEVTAANTAAMGLYLRGDVGMMILQWPSVAALVTGTMTICVPT
jgi:opacity protein-like surface antigen